MVDPIAAGESKDVGAVEPPGGTEVQVLDAGREPELGLAQEPSEPAVFPDGDLTFQQQPEAIFEGQLLDVRHRLLFFQGGGHAGETEVAQLGEGRFKKHGSGPQLLVE
jgi:hypothetical protein